MLEPLLWIVGTYLLGALIVHAAHAWHSRGSGQSARHLVLIARNEQHRIEWVIRSLLLRSWLKGSPIRLTMIDRGSSDHTRTIMRRLAEQTPFDWFSVRQDHELDTWMATYRRPEDLVIDLSRCEHFSPRVVWI